MNDHAPKWLDRPPRRSSGPGKVLLTTDRYPVFYLQITKCGCTFLRNLLYYLDHDKIHADSTRIHSHDEDFVKSGTVPAWIIRSSPFKFAVIRNPVDRFLSLYFDKIADHTNKFDTKLRRHVSEQANLVAYEVTDLAGHQDNCLKMLKWLKLNLAGKTPLKINPHWMRQSNRLSKVSHWDMKYITLDGLSWQLPIVLSGLIPDIAEKMAAVRTRNASQKLFTKDQIVTLEIEQAVHDIYQQDAQRYQKATADWGKPPIAAE